MLFVALAWSFTDDNAVILFTFSFEDDVIYNGQEEALARCEEGVCSKRFISRQH